MLNDGPCRSACRNAKSSSLIASRSRSSLGCGSSQAPGARRSTGISRHVSASGPRYGTAACCSFIATKSITACCAAPASRPIMRAFSPGAIGTDAGVFNVFAAAALRAADGAYLLGEMAPSTAAAGQLYFPCGTPDPEDITARRHARSCRQPRPRTFGGNRHRHRHTRCCAGLVPGARPRLRRLDETAHGTAKRRGASLGDHAPSGERAAAGIVRRPHRAWAGGVRSADAGVHRRVLGASLAAMSGHAGLARPIAGNRAAPELAQANLLPLQGSRSHIS